MDVTALSRFESRVRSNKISPRNPILLIERGSIHVRILPRFVSVKVKGCSSCQLYLLVSQKEVNLDVGRAIGELLQTEERVAWGFHRVAVPLPLLENE